MWRVLGASACGTSHQRAGIPCQDAHKYLVLPNGVLVAAVADGAGSAKHACRGSSLAVESVVSRLEQALAASGENIDDAASLDLLQRTIEEVRSDLILSCSAENRSEPPIRLQDLATTLLFCFATESIVAAAQIGDGAIVEVSEGGEVHALTQPARGEYINQTTFVTSDDFAAAASYKVKDARATQALVLITDGMEPIATFLPDGAPFAPFFQNVHRYAQSANASSEALAAFLESEHVCARTDDDKTLVIAVRDPLAESRR